MLTVKEFLCKHEPIEYLKRFCEIFGDSPEDEKIRTAIFSILQIVKETDAEGTEEPFTLKIWYDKNPASDSEYPDYDVSAFGDDGMPYSVLFTPITELCGYYIDDKSIDTFGDLTVAAFVMEEISYILSGTKPIDEMPEEDLAIVKKALEEGNFSIKKMLERPEEIE